MSNRIPVVSLDGLHDALPSNDTIAGRAVQLSSDAGNTLAVGADDGLYAAAGTAAVSVANSNTVSLSGDGTALTPLSGAVRLSGAGNIMTANAGGLLVVGANSNSTIAGSSTTEAVTPNGLKSALNSGAKYPINIAFEGPPGTGGTTFQASLTQPGGGGAPTVIRASAITTGDSGAVRLINGSVNSSHNVSLWGIDLSVQSSASSGVKAVYADVKGSTGCSGLDITLSTNAATWVNTLRFSTADDGLYLKGKIVATGTITPSDARLKRNIRPLASALDFINALRVVTCEKTTPEEVGQPEARYVPSVDVLAQELQRIGPEHVETLSNGYLGVNDRGVFYRLVRAVQELAARVVELESQR